MTTTLLKCALRREEGYPVGMPAPMYLVCPCSEKIPANSNRNECACGKSFDSRGWLVAR